MNRTAAAALVLLFATVASADEAFLLNIPQRFDASQETGEVRVLLTLGADPSGAQLVVNNATTVPLGATQSVGGDSVAFLSGSAANTVRIVYQPLSNFGGDFCLGGGAVEKNIPLRFVGPDIVKYSMTSYAVAAPAAECSKASKRVADAAATLVPNADGVAPALDAENGGRLPLDVAIVLDKSGSMSELPPDAAAGATKAEILRSAMKTFVATWSEMDVTQPDDRIGVVFFSSTATSQSLVGADPPANFFLRRGTDEPGPDHDWNPIGTTIDTLSPSGATSIGAGINAAMAQWTSDPDSDLSILAVTDGKQNTAPLIEPTPGGFLTLTPVGGLPAELRQRFVPIRTIGFGTPGAVDGALLTNIAFETAGVSFISINATTMFDSLALTLVSILKGNTAALAVRHNDTLTGAPSAPRTVLVDGSVKRAVFSVQWAPPRANALELEVIRPDGTLALPDSASKTPQSSLQSFDMDRDDGGAWRVRVKRAPSFSNAQAPTVPYSLHVYFVERSLDFRLEVEPKRVRTGDTISVRVRASYDGRPLDKLPAGAIKVRVQRPQESLGTILHRARTQSGGGTTTSSGDVQTAYDSKLSRLGRGLLERVVPRDVETITLVHDKRGLYTGSFNGTSVAGRYAFEAVLDWTDPRTGRLRREERLEAHVSVRPDPVATAVAVSKNVRGVVRVAVTPKDRFGNFLGPGYASVVLAKLRSAGRLDPQPADRDQTGTYVFTVTDVPPGQTPDLDIVVDGVRIGSKRTAEGKPGS